MKDEEVQIAERRRRDGLANWPVRGQTFGQSHVLQRSRVQCFGGGLASWPNNFGIEKEIEGSHLPLRLEYARWRCGVAFGKIGSDRKGSTIELV